MTLPTFNKAQTYLVELCGVDVAALRPIRGRALAARLVGLAWADTSRDAMGRLVIVKDDMPSIGQFLRVLGCERAELLGKLLGLSVYAVDADILRAAVEKTEKWGS